MTLMPCPRHGLTLTIEIEVDAMSQTWPYTSSHISMSMPCPRHGLTLTPLYVPMPPPKHGAWPLDLTAESLGAPLLLALLPRYALPYIIAEPHKLMLRL
ncbi:SCO-spondin [Gossypium arboreum]|uniref:SCO-spondin n=1 Tax=Gossypium arboreum TaxID=29729 RepID=A0A0B0NTY9_GOSAR|nr:SCO-spondin [Gossypium arboreum]